MRRNLKDALGWSACQLILRPTSDPPASWAVDDELADTPERELRDVRSEIRTLLAAGIPPDQHLGRPNIEHIPHTCRGSHSKTDFYVLKAKPSGWRLYFIADQTRRQIIFLYVVHKKGNARDPKDLEVCCHRFEKLRGFVARGVKCLGALPDSLIS